MDTTSNPVLVVCDDLERAQEPFRRLLLAAGVAWEAQHEQRPDGERVRVPYSLDNKYYSAQLTFCLATHACSRDNLDKDVVNKEANDAHEGDNGDGGSEADSEDQEHEQARRYDAVVLAFQSETSAMQLDRLARTVLSLDPAIRLCLAYSSAAAGEDAHAAAMAGSTAQPVPSLAEETLADVGDWCLANEYELVCTRPDEDALDTEDGVGRLREALEAHIWPVCTMKQHADAKHSAVAALFGGNRGLGDALVPEADQLEERVATVRSAEVSPLLASRALQDAPLQASRALASLAQGNPFMTSEDWLDNVELQNEQAEEAAMDRLDLEFGSLLQMMQQARVTAATLPSEERHALASQVIMSLAQQFDALGSDDDDDDDNDGDNQEDDQNADKNDGSQDESAA
ncbi:hypothetical protein THASP1DRAFT_31298 [Thamnocephalis sphaerospora]|uniref:Alpha and gamma adaptin binding protein p34-domain-containing protein n=1 Tax=Thamnocephalis sphaerospora TaxID=78915 RepID=A0A4P9XM24_9FUNG|nr:hypothetical protein THASP1DRAFT_31298 [Thamnocephalis sphaerospora]|eukprot:RKP06886.1 hypothetical protein THASP1DRAFT_31298 [Thamnocephalis sphaerospora]